jgi:hypothetical protein
LREEAMPCWNSSRASRVRISGVWYLADDFAYNKGLFVRFDMFERVWRRHYDRLMAPVRNARSPLMFLSDGKIDDAELEAAKEAFKARFQGLRGEIMKKFDKDGDGKLDEQERAAAREAIKEKFQGWAGDAGGNLR